MDLDSAFFEVKVVRLNYLKHDLNKHLNLPFDGCLHYS